MIEGDVQKAIVAILKQAFIDQGYPQIGLKQSNQPTKQGVPSTPYVFFTKVTNQKIGSPGRKYDNYDEPGRQVDQTDNYWIGATYQFSSLIKQDITDEDSVSAYDIMELTAAILQNISIIQQFRERGISIERITDIRQPFFLDDNDEFEAEPSFDVVLTYNQTITFKTPIADPVEADIQRV